MVVLMNFPPPSEGVHHSEPNTTAYFNDKNLGKGTLYIAKSVCCWISNAGEGFSLEYRTIFIHAVSKDLQNFPHECIYLMIDGNISLGEDTEAQELSRGMNNLSVGEGDEEGTNEMRFVPDNKNMLDVMFQALADCQALNPDPADTMSEDDDCVVAEHFASLLRLNGREVPVAVVEDEGEDDDSDMNEDQFEDAEQ